MDRIKYYYEEERDVSCRTVQSPFHPPVGSRQPSPSRRLFPMPATPGNRQRRRFVPRECCARALKPKSRKFGPFPAPVPPSTTPQGMHFSYPHDITASRSVHSINRSGKGEKDWWYDGGKKVAREFGVSRPRPRDK